MTRPYGIVALSDRGARGIVGEGGLIQIASWSSSNAVTGWNTGAGAVSTPTSYRPRRRFCTNTWLPITMLAVRPVSGSRIGLRRALNRPWFHSHRLFPQCSVLWKAAGITSSITWTSGVSPLIYWLFVVGSSG